MVLPLAGAALGAGGSVASSTIQVGARIAAIARFKELARTLATSENSLIKFGRSTLITSGILTLLGAAVNFLTSPLATLSALVGIGAAGIKWQQFIRGAQIATAQLKAMGLTAEEAQERIARLRNEVGLARATSILGQGGMGRMGHISEADEQVLLDMSKRVEALGLDPAEFVQKGSAAVEPGALHTTVMEFFEYGGLLQAQFTAAELRQIRAGMTTLTPDDMVTMLQSIIPEEGEMDPIARIKEEIKDIESLLVPLFAFPSKISAKITAEVLEIVRKGLTGAADTLKESVDVAISFGKAGQKITDWLAFGITTSMHKIFGGRDDTTAADIVSNWNTNVVPVLKGEEGLTKSVDNISAFIASYFVDSLFGLISEDDGRKIAEDMASDWNTNVAPQLTGEGGLTESISNLAPVLGGALALAIVGRTKGTGPGIMAALITVHIVSDIKEALNLIADNEGGEAALKIVSIENAAGAIGAAVGFSITKGIGGALTGAVLGGIIGNAFENWVPDDYEFEAIGAVAGGAIALAIARSTGASLRTQLIATLAGISTGAIFAEILSGTEESQELVKAATNIGAQIGGMIIGGQAGSALGSRLGFKGKAFGLVGGLAGALAGGVLTDIIWGAIKEPERVESTVGAVTVVAGWAGVGAAIGFIIGGGIGAGIGAGVGAAAGLIQVAIQRAMSSSDQNNLVNDYLEQQGYRELYQEYIDKRVSARTPPMQFNDWVSRFHPGAMESAQESAAATQRQQAIDEAADIYIQQQQYQSELQQAIAERQQTPGLLGGTGGGFNPSFRIMIGDAEIKDFVIETLDGYYQEQNIPEAGSITRRG